MHSNTEFVDSLVEKVAALFTSTSPVATLREDACQNLRSVIQSAFNKLDIVSREEFDAQVAVLTRTRGKITELEIQLAKLTEQLNT
jgi:BMFP domain-containing protein YqiC